MTHQYRATDYLVSVFFVDAAAELNANVYVGHRLDIDRRALDFLDDRVLDVRLVLDPADTAHDVFGVVLLNDAAAGRHVAFANCRVEVAEGNAVGAQRFGAHIHLIFKWRATDHGNVGYAGGSVELRANVKLVQRPELGGVNRIRRAGLNRVPKNLAERGRVRGQVRHDSGRQVIAGLAELLGHSLAGEIEVDIVFKNDRNHREVELATTIGPLAPRPDLAACATGDRRPDPRFPADCVPSNP